MRRWYKLEWHDAFNWLKGDITYFPEKEDKPRAFALIDELLLF
jgi:hypothetical protein